MYIRGLIPRNSTELDKAIQIDAYQRPMGVLLVAEGLTFLRAQNLDSDQTGRLCRLI